MKELTLADYQDKVKYSAKNHMKVGVNLISYQCFYAMEVTFCWGGEVRLSAETTGEWFYCRLATAHISRIN
jgi:hypothetical protein